MSLRYMLKRTLGKQFFTHGLHQNGGSVSATNQKFWSGVGSRLLQLRSPEKIRWKPNAGLIYFGPVLAAVIVAAHQQTEEDGESHKQKQEDSELIKSIKLAVLCIQKGEPEKAERLLHISLRVAQEQANTPAVTYIYDLLANIAFEQRNFAKAERLLQELLRRLSAASTDDNAFVEVSLKLASVFASSGDAERAELGFRFCINTQQRKMKAMDGTAAADPDTLGLWGMAVDWYARFLRTRRQFARARELTERALSVCVQLSGEAGEQSVVLLSDLGTLDLLCGDTERAAERLSRAVKLGTEHALPHLASFYVNLGLVRLRQGLLQEAERSCAAGHRLARRNKDSDALDMADRCLEKVKALL